MATGAKDGVDLIMGSQKFLCLSGRFEPPHQLFALTGRSMEPFDAVVVSFVRPMIGFRRKSPDRFYVTAQFIRHNKTRLSKAAIQSSKETLGIFGFEVEIGLPATE